MSTRYRSYKVYDSPKGVRAKKPAVEHWRQSFDYRRDYIERNPGYGFGGKRFYFCAYCGKPVSREKMQVDHVIPPSRFSKKTYKKGDLVKDSSWMANFLNSRFNLVASCPDCNRKKSDAISTSHAVRGYSLNLASAVGGTAFDVVKAAAMCTSVLGFKAARGISKPFGKFSVTGKIAYAVVLVIVFFFIISILF